ncbi:MAG: GNAT family N-acetyltransferase [Deltaproteobacteria bacterium]
MKLVLARDPELIDRIFRLRAAVWSALAPDAFATGQWTDEHDAHGVHWAVLDGGALVAAARFCAHESLGELPDARFFAGFGPEAAPIGSLNRLVVAGSHRRTGLAGRLDDARLELAAAAACATIACCTHDEHRVRMLVRRGFSVLGPAANVDPRALAEGRRPLVLVRRRGRVCASH